MSAENKELILRVNNFEIGFGSKTLFEDASLLVHAGDKITLLGQNGMGKTTFVKCVAGEVNYFGEIELTPGTHIAIMEQEKAFENSPKTFKTYLEDKDYASLWVFEDNFAKELYEKLGFYTTWKSKIIRERKYVKMEWISTESMTYG